MSNDAATSPREHFAQRYRRNRDRTRALFSIVDDGAWYDQPIALRHPIIFYEGHIPAFAFNTLVKKALGRPGIDPKLEALFARGIDPAEAREGSARDQWPDRETVRAFAAEADRRVLDALEHEELDRPGHPLLDRSQAAFTILEHEEMHQETLLYMFHRLPFGKKRQPAGYEPKTAGALPGREWIDIPAGRATLGADRTALPFAWDNETPAHTADVAAFSIERNDVTNGEFLEFVDAGGYRDPQWWSTDAWAWLQRERVTHPQFWEGGEKPRTWSWRGMFASIPLPLSWPVYATFAEAEAFAKWRGARLPSEAEYQRAAFGTPGGEERIHPWGDDEPAEAHGVFDFSSWDPEPAGTHPAGRSAWGVDDLAGNGWEWTSTHFAPFPGFTPLASYPEYSADFFDGEHRVIKGASPATARELLRPTFRNWFRERYPYVYATFRCARDAR